MKVTIDISPEFEQHFKNDRFKDSLERLKADAGTFCMAGKYEIELCEMLIKAFANAEYEDREERPDVVLIPPVQWEYQKQCCYCGCCIVEGTDFYCSYFNAYVTKDDWCYSFHKIERG